MKAGVVALSILIASIGQSYAQIESGNVMRDICQLAARGPKGELELAKATYCQGFVKAILFVGRRLGQPNRFCPPDGVTIGQAINVFLKYLNENPEQTHEPSEDLAIAAFGQAWRCK
jgi:hypothetical protein